MKRLHRLFLAGVWLGALTSCEELATGADGLYVPPPVYGYDGRRLLWAPKPGEKQCYEPWFSPDGKKVCASYRSGEFARDGELAIVDVLTGALTVHYIPGVGVFRTCWSPTGEWIAFQDQANSVPYVFLVRPDGSDLRRVEAPWAYVPRWSGDGKRLFFVCRAPGEPRDPLHVAYFDLTTEEVVILKEPWGEYGYNTAAPSPGGESIALGLFIGARPDAAIVLALADGKGEGLDVRWRAEGQGQGEPVCWSPDGDKLLVRFGGMWAGGNENLWIYDVRRRNVRQFTMTPPGKRHIIMWGCWGPNGDVVVGLQWGADDLESGRLYLIKAPEE